MFCTLDNIILGKPCAPDLTLSKTSLYFHVSADKSFENSVRKEEIARNELFFHGVFYLFQKLFAIFINFKLFVWKPCLEESKNFRLGKG